ncbi:MAG: acyl-CoA thioesterase [Neisseriaceae bacterium]|nr:MAG: acyl-CoA thioesterase [Neisseriaceae bacterium]
MNNKKLLHTQKFDIRWGDMDAYGHLNNTSYFLYVQEARFELLRAYNLDYSASADNAPILLDTSFNFKKQVTYPETILIETYLVNVDRKKVYMEQIMKSANDLDIVYGTCTSLIMWYDFKNKVTVLPPEAIHHL